MNQQESPISRHAAIPRLGAVIAAFATALTVLLVLTPLVSADSVICSTGSAAGQCANPTGLAVDEETGRLYVADNGNRRIDVFDSEGNFEMAWGWGVLNGAAELQSCTTSCQKGLPGGGAGAFNRIGDIAVDNDPTSPSQHDVYVIDATAFAGGVRVQKFSPAGEFLLTWGGGVITGGAAGNGDLSFGSSQITAVKTTKKQFAVGQVITGAGIPAATRITALGAGTITLSKPAAGSGVGVALAVAEGPGSVPVNEVQVVRMIGANATFGFRFRTSDPSPSATETPAIFTASTPASGPGSIQEGLEALPNIGPGNVLVTGPTGGPYTVEFTGTRFSDTDVEQLIPYGVGESRGVTVRNGNSSAEICTAAILSSCAAGTGGSGEGQFDLKVHLSTGPGGDIYVVDGSVSSASQPGDTRYDNRIQKFAASGAFLERSALPQSDREAQGIAIDSNGEFYVATGDVRIRKYGASGNPLATIVGASYSYALALDPSANLFSAEADRYPVIAQYDAAGSPLHRFGYGALESVPVGLAPYQDSDGDLYVSESNRVRHISIPPLAPVVAPEPCKASPLGNSKATLNAEVNPGGKETTVRFQYLTQESFEAEGGFSGPDLKETPPSSIGSDFFLHKVSTQATNLSPETAYRCRAIAKNDDAPAGVIGQEGAFVTLDPLEIGDSWVSGIGTEVATLNANVNPLGIPTSGRFQYVDQATYQKDIAELGPGHGFDHAKLAPKDSELDYGAGESFKVASAELFGLLPGTVYRYRIQAKDPFIDFRSGPVLSFRTFLPGEQTLPDGRAYELVSPAQKNSAEVGVPGPAGGFVDENNFVRIQAGSSSGEAITYTSFTAFAGPQGAPGVGQSLSRRGAGGWSTQSISPLGVQRLGGSPFLGFASDLSSAGVKALEPPLTEDAVAGYENLYLRDNLTGQLRSLNNEEPKGVTPAAFCIGYGGAASDGARAFFVANGALAGAPEGPGLSLYERAGSGSVNLVSVLPSGSAATPDSGTGFGARGGACGSGNKSLANAVSADGRIVFWTYGGKYKTAESPLFARIGGTETIQLDATAKGAGPPGQGHFWAATADGSYAFFSAPGRLTPTSRENGLYRYDTAAKAPTPLITGAGSAGVLGVLGISDSGDVAYFAATAVLSGEEENAAGDKAQAGVPNVYRWQEGEGLSFIATLSSQDASNWSSSAKSHTARVSADGSHLAFGSTRSQALSGYDNAVAVGTGCQLNGEGRLGGDNPLCAQAYLFDADSGALACASCNPSGARPTGPSLLPGWSNPFEGPRYLFGDGRLFFESLDSLVPADTNDLRDVYEAERPGSGTCTSQSASFNPTSGLCVFLISSGQSEDNSYLLDASVNGRDVFFATRSRLVGWDENGNYDVYDARVGGGFPEPQAPPPACQGEACKPAPVPPPPATAAATPNFIGPPSAVQKPRNAKPKKHKGKAKKKKAKQRRAKQRQRAGQNRRTNR